MTCAWVRTPEEREEFVRSLEGSASLAIDTESDSFFHYFEKVCLLQVADSAGRVTIVDPLAVRDLSALAPFMKDAGIEKVIHGAEYDLSLMKRDFGFEFRSLFDTQIAAQLLGRRMFGLQSLLEAEFGVRLSKAAQRCDWSLRPLTEAQIRYAGEDVRHLLALRDRLLADLRKAGREAWFREECQAMIDETPPAIRREAADFLHAKGARDLRPRELAVLKELFALREVWGRELDRPLFKIVGDETLVRMAAQPPQNGRALASIRGLSPSLVRRRGAELLEAIRKGRSTPESQCPVFPDRRGKRMSFDMSRRVDRLKEWRAGTARRLDLEHGVLLPQRLIERLAIASPRTPEDLAGVPGLRRWRVAEFGPALLEAVRGK